MFFWHSLAFSMIQRMLAIWKGLYLPLLVGPPIPSIHTSHPNDATHCDSNSGQDSSLSVSPVQPLLEAGIPDSWCFEHKSPPEGACSWHSPCQDLHSAAPNLTVPQLWRIFRNYTAHSSPAPARSHPNQVTLAGLLGVPALMDHRCMLLV